MSDSEPLHDAPPVPPNRERLAIGAEVLGVVLGIVATITHQCALWSWYIEDSAISFAYSRNLARGEGLVPWVGAERIEGFSNPTWVLLLGLVEALGGDAMIAAKWIQAVLAGLTVIGVWLLARESVPRRWRWAPLLAVGFLAGNPQFAIWGASGLENALFSALLTFALWRLLLEARAGRPEEGDALTERGWGRWPVSAILWFLLAITRPEAFAYAGAAALFTLWFAARRGVAWLLGWLVTFLAPYGAWHAARYWYFAYPWPQTYYAKLETKDPNVLRWIPNRGWQYVRDWAVQTWEGAFVPALVAGAVGLRGWRSAATAAIVGIIATAFLVPESVRWWIPILGAMVAALLWRAVEPARRARPLQLATLGIPVLALAVTEALHHQGVELALARPSWWNTAAPFLVLGALGLAVVGAVGGERGWRGRLASWVFACLSMGFAIQALGDWMKAFRWFSLAAVPMSILLAAGVAAMGEGFGRWIGRPRLAAVPALAVLGLWAWAGIDYTLGFQAKPETSPRMVKARVTYMTTVADRLKLDERIRDLDVDMGAHLWWSDWQMYDVAGLVDIPFAQNRFEKAFVQEYVFQEMRPHFAHLHGQWATTSHIPSLPEWRAQYVEIPGYGAAGGQLHVGNHVRRDLIVRRDLTPPESDRIELGGGISIRGWSVPASLSPVGGYLRVHLDMSATKRADNQNFRVLVFLAAQDGALVRAWDAAPGYDWLKPNEWKPEEIFTGKYDFPLPSDAPEGTYDLGIVVLDDRGLVSAPLDPAALAGRAVVGGSDGVPAVLANGELRFPAAVHIGSREAVEQAAEAGAKRAADLADGDDCAGAEEAWDVARLHVPKDKAWADAHRPPVAAAIARCHVRLAAGDPDAAVGELKIARTWDLHDPQLLAAAASLADRLYADGLAAREAQDWEAAYRAFADAVAVDPTRSWARRYAEEARAYRLGYDPASKAKAEADRQKRMDDLKNRAKARPTAPATPKAKAKAKAP